MIGISPLSVACDSTDNLLSAFDEVWEDVDGMLVVQPLIQAIFQCRTGTDEESATLEIRHDEWLTDYEALYYMAQGEYSDNGAIPLYISLEPLNEGVSDKIINRKDLANYLEFIPIAYDALVFFVNSENAVNNINSNDVAAIYTGEITNWKELGCSNMEITAFQRPESSYSQALLGNLVISEQLFTQPPKQWIYANAGDEFPVFEVARSYDNSQSALGYTLFLYAQGMYGSENMKFLSVDGVTPDHNSIQSGEYPWRTTYYAIFPKDTPQDHPVRTLVSWLQTAEGQSVVKSAGFVPLMDIGTDSFVSPELYSQTETHQSSGTGGLTDRNDEPLVYTEYCFDGIRPGYSDGSHSYWDTLPIDLPENAPVMYEIAQWKICARKELLLQFSSKNIKELGVQEYVFIYGNLVSYYLSLGIGSDTVIQTAVFDLKQGKQLQLSDLFLDGYNYIDHINQTLLQRSFREGGEELGMFRFEEQSLKRSFSGLPAEYQYFIVSQEGMVCIAFPGTNPFVFVPSFQDVFLVDIPIWHDISPWGGCKIEQSFSVTTNYNPNVFCYTLSVTIDEGQYSKIEDMVNEMLSEASDSFREMVDAQPLPLSQYYSSVTCAPFLEAYGSNYYSFAVKAIPSSSSYQPTISGFIINLHTGEALFSDEQAKALAENPAVSILFRSNDATIWEAMQTINNYSVSESAVVYGIWLGNNADYEQTIEVDLFEADGSYIRISVPLSAIVLQN